MIYAVNRKTKEHRVISGEVIPSLYRLSEYWFTVTADADGWIKHDGQECPLPDGVYFQAIRYDGLPTSIVNSWEHRGVRSDIIAYRPILEDKEQDMSEQEWAPGDTCHWSPDGWDHGPHRIIAVHEGMAWISSGEGDHDFADLCDLYPIRTAAQRAEDEAVEAIEQHAIELRPAYCRKLYHAIRDGRIPGVKLEGE